MPREEEHYLIRTVGNVKSFRENSLFKNDIKLNVIVVFYRILCQFYDISFFVSTTLRTRLDLGLPMQKTTL